MNTHAETLSTLIHQTDWRIVLGALQPESPGDIAVLVVSLPPQQGADILSRLSNDRRMAVVEAITELDMMEAGEIEAIFERIQRRIEEAAQGNVLFDEGSALLAGLLAKMDIRTQEDILRSLSERKPEVSVKVRDRLLNFGELIWLDDASIRLLLDNLEFHTLAIALKSATPEVCDRFAGIMSAEEIELLDAEIAGLSQEHALASRQIQRVIVDTVRKFQAQGMIQFRPEE